MAKKKVEIEIDQNDDLLFVRFKASEKSRIIQSAAKATGWTETINVGLWAERADGAREFIPTAEENPETAEQHLKRKLADQIKDWVKHQEQKEAIANAKKEVHENVDKIDIT